MDVLSSKYEKEMNLLEFAKKYNALDAIIPPSHFSQFLKAYSDGVINKNGFNKCIEKYLSNIVGVGIFKLEDGTEIPFVKWRKNI